MKYIWNIFLFDCKLNQDTKTAILTDNAGTSADYDLVPFYGLYFYQIILK